MYDGNRVAGFPDVMASVIARTAVGAGQAAITVRHVGGFFVDNTETDTRRNDTYTVVDLSGRLPLPAAVSGAMRLKRVELDVRLNNLFDARYTTFGYVEDGVPLFIPAASRNIYVGLTLGM